MSRYFATRANASKQQCFRNVAKMRLGTMANERLPDDIFPDFDLDKIVHAFRQFSLLICTHACSFDPRQKFNFHARGFKPRRTVFKDGA